MLMLLPALALTACSDDDDTVHVNFDQSTVAGSWKVEKMDSVVLTTDNNGKMERTTIQTVNYDSRYASFNNDKSYSIYETAGGATTTILERGHLHRRDGIVPHRPVVGAQTALAENRGQHHDIGGIQRQRRLTARPLYAFENLNGTPQQRKTSYKI